MNPNQAFRRKIVYFVVIAALLGLLAWFGLPASRDPDTNELVRGGVLAQLRDEHDLSQAKLGEIDPTSETIKLATLGLRGVASNILWEKAHRYKKKKDWTNLSATLEQLTKLQPNFISVWRFQAWNLSYNVSVEFDDWRERYRWVIRGIDFLKQGIEYNRREPRLLWDVGWFIAQKIGRADERKQFRVMFKEDDDFHESRPMAQRDNWLVGKEWFLEAEDLARQPGVIYRGMAPVLFHSEAPMCQMKYAENLETDGAFDEEAELAWKKAEDEWRQYGEIAYAEFETETGEKLPLRLNDLDRLREAAKTQLDDLELLAKDQGPDLREKIRRRKLKELSDQQRKALETDAKERASEQIRLAAEAERFLKVSPTELAREITGPNRPKARKLAEQSTQDDRMARAIIRDRAIVNFDYWRRLARVEQTEEAIAARKLVYEGAQAFRNADLERAAELFGRGAAAWRKLLDTCRQISEREDQDMDEQAKQVIDEMYVDDVKTLVGRYRHVLDKLDSLFPPDFALQEVIRAQVNRTASVWKARQNVTEGDEAYAEGEKALKAGETSKAQKSYLTARRKYDEALESWRNVLGTYPSLVMMADLETAKELNEMIRKYAEIVSRRGELFPANFALQNFVHTQVTHAEATRDARNLTRQGDQALAEDNLPEARKSYEEAVAEWRKVLDTFPALERMSDRAIVAEMAELINRYRATLHKLDEPIPKDFPLQVIVDLYQRQ